MRDDRRLHRPQSACLVDIGLTRSAQLSLSLNGAFCPTILPLFHGSQRAALTVVPMMDLHAFGGTARPLGRQHRP
jgi:hypothetical protein